MLIPLEQCAASFDGNRALEQREGDAALALRANLVLSSEPAYNLTSTESNAFAAITGFLLLLRSGRAGVILNAHSVRLVSNCGVLISVAVTPNEIHEAQEVFGEANCIAVENYITESLAEQMR